MSARYLVDKSALARTRVPAVDAVLAPLITAGEVATCGMIMLEVLFSARSAADLRATRAELMGSLIAIPTIDADFDRAIDTMEGLAARGQHRAASLPDLLIAAVAERAGLVLMHYDEDFDRIAAVTGQPTQWVVPRGSI